MPSDPRLDLIRELTAANVPEPRIQEMLNTYDAEISPYEQQVSEQAGVTPRSRMEVARQQALEKEQFKQYGKTALGAGIVIGAPYLGGLGAAALAPEGYGVLAGIAGQTTAGYGGELLRQKLMGEPISQREARKQAAWVGIPAAAGYGLTKVLGAAGGVAPQASEYVGMRSRVIPRYDLTMMEPKTSAELELGRRVGREVGEQAKPLTPGRIAEAGYIHDATQARQRIDPQPIIDTLRSRMLKTPKTRGGRNYNRRLDELVKSLEDEKAVFGGLTPDELDELISGELDPSIYRGGKPSSKLTAKGMVPARETARETLMGALPPEASIERARAAQELTRRELATSYFGGKEKVVTKEIRSLFQPGNEGALESLRGVSRQAGIDFEKMARELMVKRAFNADDRVKAGMLHRIMLSLGMIGLATGRPGYAAAGVLAQPAVARLVTKIVAPLQMLLGPGGALMSQVYKRQYALRESPTSAPSPTVWKETQVTPEEMFPGMTNIGAD